MNEEEDYIHEDDDSWIDFFALNIRVCSIRISLSIIR